MFASDQQRSLAIRVLLPRTLQKLWTEHGPTEEAVDYVLHGSPLSSGEKIMLAVAFDFWNGQGDARFSDVANRLDSRNTHAVASLMIAVVRGSLHVDEWIETQIAAEPDGY